MAKKKFLTNANVDLFLSFACSMLFAVRAAETENCARVNKRDPSGCNRDA